MTVQVQQEGPQEATAGDLPASQPKRTRGPNKPKDGPQKPVPSVGRIVHYTTDPGGETRAAIVTGVEDEETGLVSLVVFNSTGAVPTTEAVEFSEEPQSGAWSWPPRT